MVNDEFFEVDYVYLNPNRQLVLDPDLNPPLGSEQFVLVTTLDDYNISHEEIFNVNLSPCQILSISAPSDYISEYTYFVGDPN